MKSLDAATLAKAKTHATKVIRKLVKPECYSAEMRERVVMQIYTDILYNRGKMGATADLLQDLGFRPKNWP